MGDDNTPCHQAKMVQEWSEVLICPPNSPDLNPVENLWDVLDKHVQSKSNGCLAPYNLQDLKVLLLTFWYQIPQLTFRGLVEFVYLSRLALANREDVSKEDSLMKAVHLFTGK